MNEKQFKLNNSWDTYVHFQDEPNWDYSSYLLVDKSSSLNEIIYILNEIDSFILEKILFFIMKDNIKPLWEDIQNSNGGCFSFKVFNKNFEETWKKVVYSLIGNTLTIDEKNNSIINGLSLSPKKNFFILKIWTNSCEYKCPSIFININGLEKNKCIFRKHSDSNS